MGNFIKRCIKEADFRISCSKVALPVSYLDIDYTLIGCTQKQDFKKMS